MEGVIAAVPTPMNSTGQPLKEPFLEHCRWALANGCDGLNILGSTGEANSFTHDDRRTVMTWAAEELTVDRLMVGTGTPSFGETISLTRHAASLGYGTALILPPYYYKPVSEAGLIDWYTRIHQALAQETIEIHFYNFPQMAGLTIPIDVIATLARNQPARFTGIKDSSGDLDYCRTILSRVSGFRVFPSSETSLAEAHQSGFAGCISATVNITAPLCAPVWADRANPEPKAVQEIARQRNTIAGPYLVPAVKYLVGRRSQNAVWRSVLPPFRSLPDADGEELVRQLHT